MSVNTKQNKTQEKIIAVSSEYFFRNGHRGITMDELAALIGISKKTIYVYFPTKLALLEEVLQRKFENVFAQLDEVRQSHEDNTAECFLAVMERWQELLSHMQPVFWRDVQLDASIFLESTVEKRKKIVHRIFGRIIRDGIAKGDMRSDMNPDLVADILLASAEGIIRSGKALEYNLAPRDLLVLLVRLVIEGSFSDSGREKWNHSGHAIQALTNKTPTLS